MTLYNISNLEILVNLTSLNIEYFTHENDSQSYVDAFYFQECKVLEQTAPVDRNLEQICNIY